MTKYSKRKKVYKSVQICTVGENKVYQILCLVCAKKMFTLCTKKNSALKVLKKYIQIITILLGTHSNTFTAFFYIIRTLLKHIPAFESALKV